MRILAISFLLVTVSFAGAQEPAEGVTRPAVESSQDAVARARKLLEAKDADGAQAEIEKVIEADPDCMAAHSLMREVLFQQRRGTEDRGKALTAALVAKYQSWCQRFPKSHGVQFGLGALFSAGEDPRARPHLLEAVRLEPKLAEAWQMLSGDAERWGEQEKAREYMNRAAAAAPESPDYAFYAASNLRQVDKAKWVTASLDVAHRFPQHERGAQALYWLAERASTDQDRIAFAEQAREKFSAERFSWTRSVMPVLFDAYLRTEPSLALALAREQEGKVAEGDGAEWKMRVALAENYLEVKKLLAAGNAADAAPLAEKMSADRFSSNNGMIALLKAEVTAKKGEVQAAYDALIERMASTPEDATRTALLEYGKTLNQSAEQVSADIHARRDAQARPAPEFELQRYDSAAKTSLADYRGKVVLLTFWFPGCGPCRGEFPNFENVLARFKGKDVAYVGINGIRDQDDYVQSFMAGTRYTFTPLRGEEAVTKAYGVRGYPANFLIDKEGRTVYRNFRTNDHNELLLQRMIESLLEPPAVPTTTPGK